MSLKTRIGMSILRRLLGYAGVAGVAGLDGDIVQAGGAVMAAVTVVWSIYEKVKEARAK